MSIQNLEIYELGRNVPSEAQKSFNNGKFSGTDINPMWRIKKLTEIFGPAGIGWYYDVISERAEEHGDMTIAVVDLNLYVKWGGEWSKPIYGTGGNVLLRKGSTSDEGYKMALTDALSVACKALGIGADIYFSKDKTKYTDTEGPQREPQGEAQKAPPKADLQYRCTACNKVLEPYIGKAGTEISIREHATLTEKKFGVVLCRDCCRKLYPDAFKTA